MLTTQHMLYITQRFYKTGICISRPPALALATGPGLQFVFTGPGPQFVFTGPGPQFVFNGPGPQFVFTDPDLKCVFTGPGPKFLFTGLGPGPGLAYTNLVPQFEFTDPGLRLFIPCSEFAFNFLSIVEAVTAVISAIVVISQDQIIPILVCQ